MGHMQRDVRTIDLQVTQDANVFTAVRKANVHMGHDKCKTKVRCLITQHVANKVVPVQLKKKIKVTKTRTWDKISIYFLMINRNNILNGKYYISV